MQTASSPPALSTTNDETPSSTDNDATPRERHAKRFSHATDSSYEAPSIATTTASGQARRAADNSNRETLLAYWNAEQDDAAATAAAAASHVAVYDDAPSDGFLTPNPQDNKNGFSPTSRSRSPGERRNLSAYRPVAGRWTSQIDDQAVESPIAQPPDTMTGAASPSQRAEATAAADPQGRGLGLQTPTMPATATAAAPAATPHSEHRKSGSTPTPLETVEERSGDEHSRHDRSPERSYRKPLPEHEFGNSSPYDKFANDPFHAPISPASPIRNMAELQSMLQQQQQQHQQQQQQQRPSSQQRFSVADSDGMTSSKRTSDQSHFSAATGALHQHVERLRAGPTYQIDEDATQLITGRADEDQLRAPFSYNPTPPSPVGHRSTMSTTMLPTGNSLTASPQSGRGRAWSLSLINKLKHRTRKASDASLLSARVPSLTQLNSPSLGIENVASEKAASKSGTSSILGRKASVSRAPLSPLSSARREAEQGSNEAAVASSGAAVELLRSGGGKRRHSRDFAPHLYQLARRPSRKASPTTASSDAEVFSSRAASGLVAAAVDSPTMQRNYSATSSRTQKAPQQRPASIGSRKSSRSKRSSSGSLRATASSSNGAKAQGTRSKEAAAAEKRLTIKVSTPPASSSSATTASSPWWNPWSRKGSTTGLSGTSAGATGDQTKRKDDDWNGGWVDETEDERGIVSPVAEDPNKAAQQMQGGPEKSQQPWAPAWSNRIHQNNAEGESTQQTAQSKNDAAGQSPSKEAFTAEVQSGSEQQHEHVAYITPPSTLTPRTETSGFSSLAPLPAPAPVPPPRKNRKVRRRESGSNRTSSSSPNSPALGPEEHSPTSASHVTAAATAAAVEKDVASSVDLDDRRASISSAVSQHTNDRYATPLMAGAAMMQSEASHPASSSADARESLLSDDLDWATPQTNNGAGATSSSFSDTTSTTPFRRTTAAEADEMDSEANLHTQRASLVEARRPRGSTIQSQNTYNLSPVREIQTPESRFMSEQDPRSGTQSAASTFDQQGWTSHHRVSSGASLTRHLVMTPPGSGQASADVDVSSPSQQQQRRPLPAPSVVAEPRTDLAYVHRTNSIGSSFGTSTVGAGGDGSGVTAGPGARGGHASISSMKKHTGQPSTAPSEQAMAAAAVAAVANKRAKQREGMSPTGNGVRTDGSLVGRGPADGRTRSTSMPSKPRSPLSEGLAYSYEDSNQGYRTFSPTTTARLSRTSGGNNVVRDSWRSSSGPWDGKVVSPADRVQIPAARGISRPTFATVRRQRSRSVPLNELSQQEEPEPDTLYEAGPPSAESPVQYVHDEPMEAVPFAETAVQASLAALQALEKSEQAEKEGDWRARWQSEKLLGFSSSSQPASILIKARQKESSKLHPNQPHGDRLDTSSPHQDRRQPRAKQQHLDVLSSAASQNGGGEYESSNVGGTASESETAASRHRRRRRREDRERSSLRQPLKSSRQDDAVLRSKRNSASKPLQRPAPDGMPASSQHIPSAAEWDEMVVPAHARRYEGNSSSLGDQSGTASFMASGLVAPGSPQAAQSPESVQEVLSSMPHQVNHPTGETSMTTMFDHGSIMSYGEVSGAANPSTHAKHRPRKSSNAKRFEPSAFVDEDGGGGSKRRAGTETGSRHARRHDKYVNSSTVSLTKSTKSRIVRKGYGSDDILAWQASLSLAVLPPMNESAAE